MNKKMLMLAAIIGLTACSAQQPKSFQLISVEELEQWEAQQVASISSSQESGQLVLNVAKQAQSYASSSAVSQDETGPEIKILQPLLSSTVTNPLSVHVEFSSRNPESNVNMNSLKLTYKKYWGIDLTDRIVDYIDGETINAPEVELPEGKHTLEIYIEDDQENQSVKLITVEIAEG